MCVYTKIFCHLVSYQKRVNMEMVNIEEQTESMIHMKGPKIANILVTGSIIFAAIVFIITLSITVTITVTSLSHSSKTIYMKNESWYYARRADDDGTYTENNTLCSFLRQLNLSSNKKVSICTYNKAVRIDIRHYIHVGPRATIKGIWLNAEEWMTLLRLWGRIQMNIAHPS